jgi:hypothetical protein
MDQITIRPKSSVDIKPDSAEELAKEIRALDPDRDVQIDYYDQMDPSRRGVTWFQVVHILLSVGKLAEPPIVTIIVSKAIDWARSRFKAKPTRRPVFISIYGPDGKVVKSVLVKDDASEPEDRTEQH